MKSELDARMQTHQLDALIITGSAQHNPPMVYLTGGAHLTGDLIKKRGADPVLFCNPMERDEAARTGLPIRSLADYKINEILKETQGDMVQALAIRYQRMLSDLEITSGRVAIYGRIDAGTSFAVFSALQKIVPGITLIGEASDSVLMQVMATKDFPEVERIRRMGRVTTQVVTQVADFLASHRAHNQILIKTDGQPLMIGDVKSMINLWLAERNAENPEGTIFAIGRDAGIPHSSGTASDLLRLGQTIVFDIFPCEAAGGYFYDFTRTWCLGYAPDDVYKLYEDVLSVYQIIMGELQVGEPFKKLQARTCDLFEAKGHPTIRTNALTQDGYVHSVGHGLGLNVHERPWSGANASETDLLDPGVVITIEPGLYYPERGMGIRLEDTVWIRPDGRKEILAEYPMDLVIPVKRD